MSGHLAAATLVLWYHECLVTDWHIAAKRHLIHEQELSQIGTFCKMDDRQFAQDSITDVIQCEGLYWEVETETHGTCVVGGAVTVATAPLI